MRCIKLASEITENEEHLKIQKEILENIYEVLKIAKEYYSTVLQVES